MFKYYSFLLYKLKSFLILETLISLFLLIFLLKYFHIELMLSIYKTNVIKDITIYNNAYVSINNICEKLSCAHLYNNKNHIKKFIFHGNKNKILFSAFSNDIILSNIETNETLFFYIYKDLLLKKTYPIGGVNPLILSSPTIICSHVHSFKIEYLDSKSNRWISHWKSTNNNNYLPSEVRITLIINNATYGKEKFYSKSRIYI